MKKLKTLIIIALIGSSTVSFAQVEETTTKLVYAYDAAGNRIQRKIIVLEDATSNKKGTEEYAQTQQELEDEFSTNIDDNITVSVFPNPAYNELYISKSVNDEVFFQLFTINGKLITEKQIVNTFEQIDVSGLARGSYFVRINIEGKTKEWQIIKND